MKKFINDPFDYVDEMIEGIVAAHPEDFRLENGDTRVIVRADAPVEGKVAIATGGGSGHLPVFLGYVGKGLADGCSVGNVFSSPSTRQRCFCRGMAEVVRNHTGCDSHSCKFGKCYSGGLSGWNRYDFDRCGDCWGSHL